MFNDWFGLTKAVLSGQKTMTRRVVSIPKTFKGQEVRGYRIYVNGVGNWCSSLIDEHGFDIEGSGLTPQYQIGEEVAIAQAYKDVLSCEFLTTEQEYGIINEMEKKSVGCRNKMFVKAELMPHRIRITNVSLQRLQDISDEDCLKEGVVEEVRKIGGSDLKIYHPSAEHVNAMKKIGWGVVEYTPQQAFASLIDKVHIGEGLWKKNPHVFVYEFELVK